MEDEKKEPIVEEEPNQQETQEPEKKKEKKKKKISKEAEELEKLKEEFEKYKESHLRVLAEYDNFRKRSIAEKTSVYNNAVSDTVNNILPVADNIERALAQENASAEDMKKGVEMIANQFKASFDKLGITSIGEVGEEFSPELHNAVSTIESEDLAENTISSVFQKGYKLGDKVVRHAMVQVVN
ncbi:MAG: nucleotide exchange factor GrpE [Clostridia bacterium]